MSPSTEAVAAHSTRASISARSASPRTEVETPTAPAAVRVPAAVVAAVITRTPLGRIGTKTSRSTESPTIA